MLKRQQQQGAIWSKPQSGNYNHFTSTISPVNTPMRPVGRTHSYWPGATQFNSALAQFGTNLQVRQAATQLPLVKHGQLPSSVYQNGLRHAYDYVKSGGHMGPDGSYGGQMGGGNISVVEKQM